MEPKQVLPLWVRMYVRVMAIKGYSTLPWFPELSYLIHHQMQFSVHTQKTPFFLGEVGLTTQQSNTVNIFWAPSARHL